MFIYCNKCTLTVLPKKLLLLVLAGEEHEGQSFNFCDKTVCCDLFHKWWHESLGVGLGEDNKHVQLWNNLQ